MLEIRPTKTDQDIKLVRELLVEYAGSLEIDLGFQDFDQEVANLPGGYVLPTGRLFIAKYEYETAGCIALRKLSEDTCEGKRLYVKPQFRGLKIGRKLIEAIISEARKMGYSHIRGNTHKSMRVARAMYESVGFKQIAPYYRNPVEGIIFLELKLT